MKTCDAVKLVESSLNLDQMHARQFVCTALSFSLAEVVQNKSLDKEKQQFLQKCIDEVKEGKPLNKILNKEHFYGLEFYINNNVLAPRPETEILVERAILTCKEMQDSGASGVDILDLCTGSGVIGITIKKMCPQAKVVMSDISQEAIEVAKINAQTLGADVKIVQSNMFEKLSGKFDIIVSNPPYISSEEYSTLDSSVLLYDPKIALCDGGDGLSFYRDIAKNACNFLNDNGAILLEIGYNQKEDIENIMKRYFKEIYIYNDYQGIARVVVLKGVRKNVR